MTALLVAGAHKPLRGRVPCPPDRRVATLATLLAATIEGESRIRARALPQLGATRVARALGAELSYEDDVLTVRGPPPSTAARQIDAGRDVALCAFAAGLLSTMDGGGHVLSCDEALGSEALHQIAATLRQRGARIEGQLDPEHPGHLAAPLRIEEPLGAPLGPLTHELGIGQWPAKLAALSSGLRADGVTVLFEPVVSFDCAERLLRAVGCEIAGSGTAVELRPSPLAPFDLQVGGDPGLAAYLWIAAAAVTNSQVGSRAVGVAPARAGWISILRAAGAELIVTPGPERAGEPCADVWLAAPPTRGLEIDGELGMRLGWDLPACAALAGCLPAASRIAALCPRCDGDGELDAVVRMLDSFGIAHAHKAGELRIAPSAPSTPSRFDALGDPHIAMAATALALRGGRPCTIVGVERIAECFPRFVATLRAVGASIEVQP